jgi:hypothetical protein
VPSRAVKAAFVALALAGPCDAWPAGHGVETASVQGATGFHYRSIAIAQPRNDSTVFDNSGKLRVKVGSSRALRSDSGDRIAILIDGVAASQSPNTESVLTGIARGGHTLQAEVQDSKGSVVLASPAVAIHMWQASKLFRDRAR